MIIIQIKKTSAGMFEAWEIQECKCGPDKFIVAENTIEQTKEKVREMYKSGQRTPTKIKFIEQENG